jgi:hypothetical protein
VSEQAKVWAALASEQELLSQLQSAMTLKAELMPKL